MRSVRASEHPASYHPSINGCVKRSGMKIQTEKHEREGKLVNGCSKIKESKDSEKKEFGGYINNPRPRAMLLFLQDDSWLSQKRSSSTKHVTSTPVLHIE